MVLHYRYKYYLIVFGPFDQLWHVFYAYSSTICYTCLEKWTEKRRNFEPSSCSHKRRVIVLCNYNNQPSIVYYLWEHSFVLTLELFECWLLICFKIQYLSTRLHKRLGQLVKNIEPVSRFYSIFKQKLASSYYCCCLSVDSILTYPFCISECFNWTFCKPDKWTMGSHWYIFSYEWNFPLLRKQFSVEVYLISGNAILLNICMILKFWP